METRESLSIWCSFYRVHHIYYTIVYLGDGLEVTGQDLYLHFNFFFLLSFFFFNCACSAVGIAVQFSSTSWHFYLLHNIFSSSSEQISSFVMQQRMNLLEYLIQPLQASAAMSYTFPLHAESIPRWGLGMGNRVRRTPSASCCGTQTTAGDVGMMKIDILRNNNILCKIFTNLDAIV